MAIDTDYCNSCVDIQEIDPSLIVNGLGEDECTSLKNNTGLVASNGHDDCTDLDKLNDCLVGNLSAAIEPLEVCDWKGFTKHLLLNIWTVLKAFNCSMCGIWTNIINLWAEVEKLWEQIRLIWAEIDRIWAKIREIISDLASAVSRIGSIEGDITTINNNITNINNNIDDISGNIDDISGEIDDISGDISGLNLNKSGSNIQLRNGTTVISSVPDSNTVPVVRRVTITDITLLGKDGNAYDYETFVEPVPSVSGYTAVGVIGYNLNHDNEEQTHLISVWECYLRTPTEVYVALTNFGSNTFNGNCKVDILYV